MKHMRKTVTVGGGSSLGNRSKLSVLAIALTLALSALVAVPAYAANSDATEPTLWDSIVSFFTGEPAEDGVETYAVGDEVENSAVADRDSTNDWNTVLTQDGQVSTQNIGRIWTDKSVFTDQYEFQGELAGTTINKAEGSDFLVGLSALSSTSNLKTVTTTTTPLDIVLVLDVSGSMDDEMSQVYTPAYNPNGFGTYYIQNDNGGYTQLSYSWGGWGQQQGWYYTSGGGWDPQRHYVTPKTSETDADPNHVQFYTSQSVSKMDSLKSAAGGFIDSVNTMNAALPEGSEQHRIAIVKFASNSSNNIGDDTYEVPGSNPRYQNRTQIVSDFSTNATALSDAVDALDPAGATRADLGLEQAARVLNGGDNLSGAREDAKKVVIFFTDGNPTSSSGWENSVASAAVDNAYQLKNTNGATVYSIGVVSGANPDSDPTSDNTSNINKFLHSVSSNYKSATYQYEQEWWGEGSYQWDLGDRTPAPEESTEVPQYYYAAEDSAQLDQVFQDITTSIGKDNASGSPIEDTTVEGETSPGNLTFKDELGAYMEVAGDTMQIVYADQTFTSGRRTSQDIEGGVVYTYPFSGTVHANEAYGDKEANLSGLQIKVTHYNDPAKGDVVEAVIPADLIPMRNYDVDTENGTMTVSQTYPVRLFYSVQVKAEAAEQLADPSSAIYTSNYVANNNNEDGTGVEFYSNLYTNSNGDGFVGDTTATFKPSSGNRFYYFTTNTPLYTSDDGSDTQADRSFINGDNTVYYKDTYWVQTSETVEDPETGEQIPAAEEKTEYIPLSTSDIRDSVKYTASGAYLPPQTHNEDKIDDLYAVKGDDGNPTETAKDTLNPTWTVIQDDNGDNVSVISARMGNNGRLALELPGTLAVSKNVAFGDNYGNTGFDETVYTEDTDYAINITLTGEDNQPVSGTFKAQVKNAQGAVVSNPTNGYFDITFTNGKATQSIKHGETLYIYGLDAGAAYKVTETAPGDGFTTAYDNNAEGAIEVNETSSTKVTNTYTLQPTKLTGSTDLKVSKTLSNRDWREGDSFTFQIAADQSTPNAPMPDETKVTIDSTNKDAGTSFGNISYSTPGQYVYIISEVIPTEDALKGVTYSRARYRVVVDVKDDGNGTMTATSTMTQIMDDAGANIENGAAIDTHTAAFTNSYTADPDTLTGDSTTFNGTKVLEGRQWLEGETFGFTMKPVQQDGVDWSSVTYKANDEAEVATVNADSSWTAEATANGKDSVAFWFAGDFTFSKAGTYTFNVTETSHNNNALPKDGTNGMTYDRHNGVITVTVEDNGQGQLVATAAAGAVSEDAEDGSVTENDMSFENSYEPIPIVYGDEASEILGGNKIVDDNSGSYVMADGQFTFMMRAQKPGNPMPSGLTPSHDDEGREIVSVTNKNTNTQNNTATFDFGEITFTKAGTYQYNIYENETGMPAGVSPQDSGRTYTISFVVSEDLATGKLTVDASAVLIAAGDQENTPVDLNQINFTNVYNATATSGSMQIFKTLSGRNWQQGDSFTFDVSMAVDGVAADEMPTFSFDNTGATVNDFKSEAGKLSYNLTITPTASATGNTYVFSTGTATYTHEGTYVYTVTERDVDPSIPNVTKDGKTYTVTVKVTNVNNALQREVTIAPEVTTGRLDFTNTYNPDKVTVGENGDASILVQKTLAGREWEQNDSFSFNLEAVDGKLADGTPVTKNDVPMPAEGGESVSINASDTAKTTVFGDIEYSKAGVYNYIVIEQGSDHDGLTYDTHEAKVTVTITDNTQTGKLEASVSVDNTASTVDDDKQVTNAAAFTNTYDAADTDGNVTYSADLTKVLTGHEWTDGFATFDFQITKVSGTLVDGTPLSADDIPSFEKDTVSVSSKTGTNKEDGNDYATFDFGKVTFTQAGTYVYEVSEVKPETTDEKYNPGIDYSGNKATITITVTDKTTDGVSTGKLVATAQVVNNTFTNNYATGTVDVDAAGGLQIVKNMTGRDIKAGDFTFTVTSDDPAALAKLPGGKAIEVPVAASTSFSDNKASSTTTVKTGLSFSLADAGKSFTYTISETNGGKEIDGVKYDGATHTVLYEVVDGGNGTLTVNAYVDGATDPAATYTATRTRAAAVPVTVTFDNSYDAGSTTVGGDGAAVTINATKTLANRPLEDGMFTFDVTNAADKSDQPTVLLSGSNVGNKVSFNGSITYTTKSLNLDVQNGLATRSVDEQTGQATYTYTYNVSERAVQGVTQNKGSFTITVNVVDDTKGNLTASVVYPDGTTTGSLGFENTYGKTGSDTISISGTKVLSADQGLNPPDINGKYTFTITGVDESDKPLPAELMPGKSSTTNQNGNIDFGSITYTMANVFGDTGDQLSNEGIDTMSLGTRERTFTYTIEEASGSVAGVANDTAPKTVTVKVKDNGDGTITAEKSTEGQPTDFTFTNTYSVTPESSSLTGNGGFTITKELTSNTGRTPAEGEFTFRLIDVSGKAVSEATNAADGSVGMPAVTFSAPGSYGFQLIEVGGDASGMTYDKNIYDVAATVTDDRDGSLSVAWSMPGLTGKDVTFTNDYEADPTSVSVVAGKAISGRPLVDGEFTFQILENGKVVAEATNDANGQIAFPTLSYDKTGEHDYQIVEVKGNAGGVTYDDTVYTMHVSVTDNPQAGALSAKVTYPDGDPVFRNTYTEPVKPVEPAKPTTPAEPPAETIPRAGDATNTVLPAVIAASGITLAVVGSLTFARRRNK